VNDCQDSGSDATESGRSVTSSIAGCSQCGKKIYCSPSPRLSLARETQWGVYRETESTEIDSTTGGGKKISRDNRDELGDGKYQIGRPKSR